MYSILAAKGMVPVDFTHGKSLDIHFDLMQDDDVLLPPSIFLLFL